MAITISLDAFERRHLLCKKCTEMYKQPHVLTKLIIKKQPSLTCDRCKHIWAENDIRSGKANGLLFLG